MRDSHGSVRTALQSLAGPHSFNANMSGGEEMPAPGEQHEPASGMVPRRQGGAGGKEADGAQAAADDTAKQALEAAAGASEKFATSLTQTIAAARAQLLNGALTSKNINDSFSQVEQGIKESAKEMADSTTKPVVKLLVEQAKTLAEAITRAAEQKVAFDAEIIEQRKAIQNEHRTEALLARGREDSLKSELAEVNEKYETLKKKHEKNVGMLTKSQLSLKMTQLKLEKLETENETLTHTVQARNAGVITALYNDFKADLPGPDIFDPTEKSPNDLMRVVLERSKTATTALREQLEAARKEVAQLKQDIASGSSDVIRERDQYLQERDELAASLAAETGSRKERERQAKEAVADAKAKQAKVSADCQAELERMQAELTAATDERNTTHHKATFLERALDGVRRDLATCEAEVRRTQAAGVYGGYFQSAAPVRVTYERRDESLYSNMHQAYPTLRGHEAVHFELGTSPIAASSNKFRAISSPGGSGNSSGSPSRRSTSPLLRPGLGLRYPTDGAVAFATDPVGRRGAEPRGVLEGAPEPRRPLPREATAASPVPGDETVGTPADIPAGTPADKLAGKRAGSEASSVASDTSSERRTRALKTLGARRGSASGKSSLTGKSRNKARRASSFL